jgi:hypothetical protein
MSVSDRDESDQLGFDLHDRESVWASIEEDLEDDPDGALNRLTDLVERILLAEGYAVHDPVAVAGEEPEVIATYRAAREVSERAELGSASRSEVETAVDDLRSIFVSFESADFGTAEAE